MSRNDWLITGGSAIVFLVAAVWHFLLPGLQYDECLGAAPAVNFIVENSRTVPMQIDPSVVHVFGRPLPIMVMSYIGPIKTLFHIPIFAILDVSTFTTRLLPLLITLACFPLTFYVTTKFFDRLTAQLTVALVALDPSFVFYLTRDVGPAALQVFLKLSALVLLIHWWRNSSSLFFFAAWIALGLGVSHKVDFFWVIGGLVVASAIVSRKEVWSRLTPRTAAVAVAGFLLGGLPVFVFNVVTRGHTFSPLFQTTPGFSNSQSISFIGSLVERVRQLTDMLNGQHLSLLFTGEGVGTGFFMFILPAALIASLLGTAWLILDKRISTAPSATLGLWIFLLTVLVASCYSPTTLAGHHLLALYPMLHMAIAVFLATVTASIARMQRIRFAIAVATVLFVANLSATASINKLLNHTGGVAYWSDAIYELNSHLLAEGRPVAAMQWGFTNNLIVLSKGQLEIRRVYKEFWEKPVAAETVDLFLSEEASYLFHTDEFESFEPAFGALSDAVKKKGWSLRLHKVFYQRDGRPVYTLYVALPPSLAE